MIVQEIFTVGPGKTNVSDDIIFCRQLVFSPGEARLVIVPKTGAKPGALRMLKIVANNITVLPGSSPEITWNLDGDATVPLLENGLDPETPLTVAPLPLQPTKVGAKGNPDFPAPLIPCPLKDPNIASPNFCPVPVDLPGMFPKATDGGNGKPGGRGGKGVNGLRAPILEIWTTGIGGAIEVDLRGQSGGQGGDGGSGQFGGRGQDGAIAVPGTDTSWTGIPNPVCKEPAGLGGDGGSGGNSGCGGDGGDGGNGGVLKVFYTASVDLTKLHRNLVRGFGGNAGNPGKPGKGGDPGNPGVNLPPCPATTPVSQKGEDGDMCGQSDTGKGGIAQKGQDGNDGQYWQWQINTLPHVPSLFP
ncbi:MAG TPA: hypothetical protein VJR06_01370 [Nitrososphaerales archaeon]|nr:hypothetical protein [Nitrososphaerales archaeon]